MTLIQITASFLAQSLRTLPTLLQDKVEKTCIAENRKLTIFITTMDIVFTSFPMEPCQNIGHQRPGVPKQNVQAEERHNTGLN